MKSLIKWAVKNSPAMNTLMLAVLLAGAASLAAMRREVFPEFELEIVLVTVPYPGASPEEIEEGICQKIEEAVRSVDGIKKQTSVAREGTGFVVLELSSSVDDPQKVLNEIRSEVDRIPSFPVLAEDPEVKQITLRTPAIRLGVIGPAREGVDAELELRAVTEEVRSDLLQLPPPEPQGIVGHLLAAFGAGSEQNVVSQANIIGSPDYQIDIELSEENLRAYGLSLQQVAQIVRRENLELPGGTIRAAAQEVLLRGKNKRQIGEQIANIPLVTQPSGVVLTISDIGVVRDAFTDETVISRIDGRPGLAISVDRTSSEDLLSMVDAVKRYVADKELPPGYELVTWNDMSIDVQDRLSMLVRNGITGLVLVFLVLAIFLDLRLAFWVALGIPISVLGTGIVLIFAGQTLNMLSMFAFLMALGIVVDDAIVIGENVYHHRQLGKPYVRAAIDGAYEVLPSVGASVTTTIIAFLPLAFVSGVMGKFIAVLPLAVISMLVLSLIEATFVLPCHLAHPDSLIFRILWYALFPFRWLRSVFHWINIHATSVLERFIDRFYMPVLRWALHHTAIVLSCAAGLLVLSVGFVMAGITPFNIFPKLDNRLIEARITYPDGTPISFTNQATLRLEQAIEQLNEQFQQRGAAFITVRHRLVGSTGPEASGGPVESSSGSHVGSVMVELVAPESRELTSQEILDMWRAEAGDFPGAESLVFGSPSFGPGGSPIEFKLLADQPYVEELEAAVEKSKAKLRQYQGVTDVKDDSRPGKWEFQLRIKESAQAMGVPLAELAETVRAAYYGEEVMRLQRGRHEVKLMVRYPESDRRSLTDFKDVMVRTQDGTERPLTELAQIDVERGYSEINRVEQLRSVTVSADVQEQVANARQVVQDLQRDFIPALLKEYPHVSVRWEGQQEQTQESVQSLMAGFLVALLAMFVLLTMEFRSYLQPLMIMAIIPFGLIGAIAGHALLGMEVTLFSLFGLVALTGVVVNDSIVLIDFINTRVREGIPLYDAVVDAGIRRFRPVMLTSMTTIAGLLPMLLEQSFQAQILIPMATSLCFGLMLTTVLVLFLVPTYYLVYRRFVSSSEDWEELLSDTTDRDNADPDDVIGRQNHTRASA